MLSSYNQDPLSFLAPRKDHQCDAESCAELTRTKGAAGGSSSVHHIFAQNNLLASCEGENLIWP